MKARLNSRGFNLVEVLIATGILVTTASVVSYIIVNSRQSAVKLEGISLCRARAQMIVDTFKNADNKASMSNWVASAETSGLPVTAHPELAMYPIVDNAGTFWDNYVMVPGPVNSWELIDSGSNWALSLVKNNAAYCAVSTGGAPPGKLLTNQDTTSYAVYNRSGPVGTLMPPTSDLVNEKDYLSIKMVDGTGASSCPLTPGVKLVPLGPNTVGQTQYTAQITGTVTYTDQANRTLSCDATVKLKPDGRSAPPVFVNPMGVPSPVMAGQTCGIASPNIICLTPSSSHILSGSPPIACDSSSFALSFQVNEAATVFAYYLAYATTQAALPPVDINTPATFSGNLPTYYTRIASGGNTANIQQLQLAVTPYKGPANYGSGAMVTISQQGPSAPLLDGYYRFLVKAMDSAQNMAFQTVDFAIDNTRPTIVSVIAPSPLIGGFNFSPVVTRSHLPVSAPWSTAVNFGTSLFQCEDSVPTDVWQAGLTSEAVPVAPAGASWAYSVNGGPQIPIPSSSPCPTSIQSPQGLASGTYAMYAYGCDACGSAPAPSATPYIWNVDIDTAPLPAHNPTSLPTATFSTTPLTMWSLAIPKPSPDPFQYACQNPDTTFTSQVSSCAPTGLPSPSCSVQGSRGMCTAAYDGCGRGAGDVQTPYQIAAGSGQSCCNVPCQTGAGLVCEMDNTTNRGTCVASAPCAQDSDCPGYGAICYLDTNTCYGPSIGPAPQTCVASTWTGWATPPPASTATATPTAAPTATPSTLASGTVCSQYLTVSGSSSCASGPFSGGCYGDSTTGPCIGLFLSPNTGAIAAPGGTANCYLPGNCDQCPSGITVGAPGPNTAPYCTSCTTNLSPVICN